MFDLCEKPHELVICNKIYVIKSFAKSVNSQWILSWASLLIIENLW